MLRKSYFIKVFLFCIDATCTKSETEHYSCYSNPTRLFILFVPRFYPPMKLVWWQFHVKLASQTNYKNRMHRMNNIMVNLTTWYKHTNAWERVCVCVYVINTYTMGCCIGCVSQQRYYGHVHVRIHIRYFMRHCVRDHKMLKDRVRAS